MICSAEKIELNEELSSLVKDELNVLNIEFLHDADEYVSYELKPQLKTLGPKYGKNLGAIREFLAKTNANEAVRKVKAGDVLSFEANGQTIEIGEADLLIALKNKEGYASDSNGNITVVLDTTLDQNLINLGTVSEFVSKVQNLRKDSGLEVTNHIALEVSGDESLVEVVMNAKEEIAKTVLADTFTNGNKGDYSTELAIGDKKLVAYICKI
jgi:isoleucyl-tRNA synthetase